jgi:aldehyde oxidoreductase
VNDLARSLDAQSLEAPGVRCTVNGRAVLVQAPPVKRLAAVLREDLGLTGTKVGCNAGDCGACTVLLDRRQVCACLVPLGQIEGRSVVTVEGLAEDGRLSALQAAFLRHGAAQCGICTPGMLIAATELLQRDPEPDRAAVLDALAGVLCRCTGYQKIVDAVLGVAHPIPDEPVPEGVAVGVRVAKVDGPAKLTGRERYGADGVPANALWLRVVRSPHVAARFTIGDLGPLARRHPGLRRVLTAADVPHNAFGILPHLRDQPVLADGIVRHRGEAVAALMGESGAVSAIRDEEVPILWQPEPAVLGVEAAMDPAARSVQGSCSAPRDSPIKSPGRPDNLLIEGRCRRGDLEGEERASCISSEILFETAFVEHAYIEPEAGWARVVDGEVEIHATTQSPYLDRDEVAHVLGLEKERVRILPTACGGGFGGKLDLSVQPLLAVAARLVDRPVALVYERPESMAATTKRHAARLRARAGADAEGRLRFYELDAEFDTGAYASWGPTVAGRVPVHAPGPYRVDAVRAAGRAWFTNAPPAGAFRGFGVPQAALAHETLMDDLALGLGVDRLEFRHRNAIAAGDSTPSGQKLQASCGLRACLDALRPRWQDLTKACQDFNYNGRKKRQGIGIGCMWYGIGNTGMAHPSTIRIGLRRDGRVVLFNGAVDIGQGSNTILTQIAADALGAPVELFELVMGDTGRTADAGKTSASRQTFVSGKAAELAARELRTQILRRLNAGEDAIITFGMEQLIVDDGAVRHRLDLGALPADPEACVLLAEATFDPPAAPLDQDGQGEPYPTYGFGAQIARVEVDLELGTTRVLDVIAAHDVGRAINPQQVEGQIEGGIAQGLGFALMEEYLPGRTENLHDYLIPTVGDMPRIEVHLIEDPEPLGPFGAKGVGEPGLIPTAPAILGAIRHATGVRLTRVPVLPHRLHAALRRQGSSL